MDLTKYIGKFVKVRLYRKRSFREFYGRLAYVKYSEICLVKNGVPKWVRRPSRYRDSIKEVAEK